MYLSTTSTTQGVYTPPQYEGDTGRYKETTKTETTDERQPSLGELKETLATQEAELNDILQVFEHKLDHLNKVTGSDYKMGSIVDYYA